MCMPTFEPTNAEAVHRLLDDAYRDSALTTPLAHEDWNRSMARDAGFDPSAWWLAEREPREATWASTL